MTKSILDLLKDQVIGKIFVQDFGDQEVIDKYKVLEVKYDGQGSTPRFVVQFEESRQIIERPISLFYTDFLEEYTESAQSSPKCTLRPVSEITLDELDKLTAQKDDTPSKKSQEQTFGYEEPSHLEKAWERYPGKWPR